MLTRYAFMGLAAASCMSSAEARPVSYPGGWTVMLTNDGDHSSQHVHFTPEASYSIGLYTEQNWDLDQTFAGLQVTRLVKRWNAPQSQGNLYVHLGAGVADAFGSQQQEVAGFAGVQADWETRRWFLSYDARVRDFGEAEGFVQSGRVGVAPYVAEFGALHTWAMLELAHHPDAAEEVSVTPLLRFFKGNGLMEIGYTPQEKEFMFNWMYRF
jgi:hypothetical protein